MISFLADIPTARLATRNCSSASIAIASIGLQGNGRRRILYNPGTGLQHGPHALPPTKRGLCVGSKAHTQRDLMRLVRAAETVSQPCLASMLFGSTTTLFAPVSKLVERQLVSGDTPCGAVAQLDPVADCIGLAERQRDAGKDIAEGILQCEAQDDGDDTGGGNQGSDRHT